MRALTGRSCSRISGGMVSHSGGKSARKGLVGSSGVTISDRDVAVAEEVRCPGHGPALLGGLLADRGLVLHVQHATARRLEADDTALHARHRDEAGLHRA